MGDDLAGQLAMLEIRKRDPEGRFFFFKEMVDILTKELLEIEIFGVLRLILGGE